MSGMGHKPDVDSAEINIDLVGLHFIIIFPFLNEYVYSVLFYSGSK